MILAPSADELKTHREAMASLRKGQVDAGQAEQRPPAAEQRVAGGASPQWSLAGGAGGEEHVEAIEEYIDAALGRRGAREIGGVLCTGDSQALVEDLA
jgi:hypothetical protein